MPWIYKYKDITNEEEQPIVYVGLVYGSSEKELERRIYQHEKERMDRANKWYNYKDKKLSIEVINKDVVKYRMDAEILEGYFINKYNSGIYLNDQKTMWGTNNTVIDKTVLSIAEFSWQEYTIKYPIPDCIVDLVENKKLDKLK